MDTSETAPDEKEQQQREERQERSVLLVMQEHDTARLLAEALAFHGMRSEHAQVGSAALAAVQRRQPDLVVMDLAQPDMDGLVLCADLRARTEAPIIVYGDSEKRREALLAFRLGADDFVTKPFDVDDMVARAEVALRRRAPARMVAPVAQREQEQEREAARAQAQEREVARAGGRVEAREDVEVAGRPQASTSGTRVERGEARARAASRIDRVGALALDHTHHRVTVGDQEVRLSRSEYLLLGALVSRPAELLSRLELARAVWGDQLARVGRPIDQHMYRLRSKLQKAADEVGVVVPSIVSVPGFGYRLVGEEGGMAAVG